MSPTEYDYGGESDKAEPDRSGPIRTGMEPARLGAKVRKVGAGERKKAE
jgi:hypothetical protein